jgi:cell division septum initiation protein DivIVA
MSIYRVIDKLEAYVQEGTMLPLRYRILSEERLLELIEKMRSTLPEEVGRARTIAKDKDRVLRDAQEKAQQIVTQATETHAIMLDEHQLVQAAKTTADVVLREAEEKARRIREGADQYAAQVLADLEARLTTALGSVRKGQDALSTPRGAQAAAIREAAAQSKRAAFDAGAAAGTASEQQAHIETATLEISR